MKLSKRMLMNISLIKGSNLPLGEIGVADIGCDHGFVAIYLVENKLVSHAIAMDVAMGPLSSAKENIKERGLESLIETRLSDGAGALEICEDGSLETDVILIAGMGGRLTLKLLEDSIEKCLLAKYIVIQPQSELELVRKRVYELGFVIDNEDMVLDDGKYYTAIGLIPRNREAEDKNGKNGKASHLTDIIERLTDNKKGMSIAEYKYGAVLLEKKHLVLKDFLEYKRKEFEKIYGETKDNSPQKAAQIMAEIKIVDDCIRFFTG